MEGRFKFFTVGGPEVLGETANIFIHGYSSGNDLEDRLKLLSYLPGSLKGSTNIFCFWSSGYWTGSAGLNATSLLAAIAVISRKFGLPGLTVSLLASGTDAALGYFNKRGAAEKMGDLFIDQLFAYLHNKNPHVRTVNLVGHSLGARLVIGALSGPPFRQKNKKLKVNDVVLMAAASACSLDKTSLIKARIQGRLVNAYSEDDYTLIFNYDEESIGRINTVGFENFEFKGYGHTDYWPKLGDVLKSINFSPREDHFVFQEDNYEYLGDKYLYGVMSKARPEILDQAVKYLRTSKWCSIKNDEPDKALAFDREFRSISNSLPANLARFDYPYVRSLVMLGENLGMADQFYKCANIVKAEEFLVKNMFLIFMGANHPLAEFKRAYVKTLNFDIYSGYVSELAGRLGVNSVLKGGHFLPKLKAAIKPGVPALMLSVAIVFYARVSLGDYDLM